MRYATSLVCAHCTGHADTHLLLRRACDRCSTHSWCRATCRQSVWPTTNASRPKGGNSSPSSFERCVCAGRSPVLVLSLTALCFHRLVSYGISTCRTTTLTRKRQTTLFKLLHRIVSHPRHLASHHSRLLLRTRMRRSNGFLGSALGCLNEQ